MKTALIDTSFLFALVNPQDRNHAACAELARTNTLRWRIPVTVLPEIAYLLEHRLDHRVMAAFVKRLGDPEWEIEPVVAADLIRCAEILERYADSRLDFVDATLVAIAERIEAGTILTLDRRHFQLIRPQHISYFTLLP